MRNAAHSAAWCLALLATAGAIGWPVLNGGTLTYLDNPAHLAEIHALAAPAASGWSDIGFCGFPIGLWHSPLGYGLLALAAQATHADSGLYAVALWVGFAAPALALFVVARRRLPPLPAGLLAYLLLIQPCAVHGIQSAFGGMWTFYISAAFFLLLCDRLAADDLPFRRAAVAACVGVMGLTHFFPFYAMGILFILHAWTSRNRRGLALDVAAVAAGLMASAAYWLPNILSHAWLSLDTQNLRPLDVLRALALPVDLLELTRVPPNPAVMHRFAVPEAIPSVLLIVLGLSGVAIRPAAAHRASKYGLILALAIALLLTTVVPFFDSALLGPISWRMLYFCRLGFALAAIPWLVPSGESIARGPTVRIAGFALPVLIVASGFYWAQFLNADVPAPDGPAMRAVDRLWACLKPPIQDPLERCYVQDTFQAPGTMDALKTSHVLALTSRSVGGRQVGAYYGVVPFPVARWTRGEYGFLFHRAVTNADGIQAVRSDLRRSHCRTLVLVEPRLNALFQNEGDFARVYEDGVFGVYRWTGADPGFCEVLHGDVDCAAAADRPGRIRLTLHVRTAGAAILIKEAFHPFWRIDGARAAQLGQTDDGLMRLDGLTPGSYDLTLAYRPPRFPTVITGIGWLLIVGMAFRAGLRRSDPRELP